MEMRTKRIMGVLALAGVLVFSLFSVAGDLEPSAPPGPTMKTLSEVEPRIPISSLPYTISAPGSYYLTGDLTTPVWGIVIEANDVTIDLMGYSLIGSRVESTRGIFMEGRNNVEIRNGTVRNFGHTGIWEASLGKGHRVIGVRAVSNGGSGIHLIGSGHLVKDCTAVDNGSDTQWDYGICVGEGCTVTGNTAYDNHGHGILAGASGCTVTGNTVKGNARSGILVHSGSLVIGNTVTNNNDLDNIDDAGIKVHMDCLVKANIASGNKQNNIFVHGWYHSAIEENLVTNSTNGISFGPPTGNFLANNRASGNTNNYVNAAYQTDGGGNVSF